MVKKHTKPTKEKKGGIFPKESYIHISNIKLVDIVDPKKRVKIAEAQLFETFGESKALQQSAYEHFGDLYAGLPSKVTDKVNKQKKGVAKAFLD
jgi:ribosomal protein L24